MRSYYSSITTLTLVSFIAIYPCYGLPENSPYRNFENVIDLGQGYILGKIGVTNSVAKEMCHFAQKHLVSIETIEKDKLIISLLSEGVPNSQHIWTSGRNSIEVNVWLWDNGEPFFHSRWWNTHPKNINNNLCVALHKDIKYKRYWFTEGCEALNLPLCETRGNETKKEQ